MNFRQLPLNIQNAIKDLTVDEEFQIRFRSDKILDQLDEQKFNRGQELQLLTLLYDYKTTIEGIEVNAITPKIWSLIWILDNGFVNSKKQINEIDIDLFMYLLQNPIKEFDPVKILTNSLGYCSKNNIEYDVALRVIELSIKLAFKPLNLFPKTNTIGNQMMYYDAEWITSTVAKVHAVTGLKPNKIMNMSMTAICYYFAQYARVNGSENIYRRSPEEILIEQDKRCCQLVIDRLIEKGIIKEQQRDEIFKQISKPVINN